MKCVNCRHRLKGDSPICPNCAFDMSHYIEEAASAPKFSTKKKILVALLTLVLVCVGGVAALFFSNTITSPRIAVGSAMANTVHQLSTETATLKTGLPLLAHLSQVESGQSTLTLSSSLAQFSGALQITMDLSASQFIVKGSTNETTLVAATGYLSPQAAIVNLEDSGNAIGLNLHTLVADLTASAFADSFDLDAISASYRTDILENTTQMDEELTSILSAASVKLISQWDAQRLGEETLTLNGDTIETTAYSLDIDPATVSAVITGILDDICASPVFSPYLALLAHQSGLSPEALHSQLNSALLLVLEDILQLEQCTFTTNIYDGHIVLLTANRSSGSYALALSPGDDLLSYVALVARDETSISPYLTLSLGLENGVFSALIDLLGSETSLLYFTQDTSDNFIVSSNNIPLYIATVNSSQPDTLTLALPLSDGYLTATSTLVSLNSDWFTPPTYTNLLTMSQTDLMLLAMALSY